MPTRSRYAYILYFKEVFTRIAGTFLVPRFSLRLRETEYFFFFFGGWWRRGIATVVTYPAWWRQQRPAVNSSHSKILVEGSYTSLFDTKQRDCFHSRPRPVGKRNHLQLTESRPTWKNTSFNFQTRYTISSSERTKERAGANNFAKSVSLHDHICEA